MTASERIAHLRGMEPHLRGRILAQDHVMGKLAAAFARGELGVAAADRPRASFLLAGPTGTGKTETFRHAVAYACGPGRLVTFDMSEFQDVAGAAKLIGASPEDPGQLGRALGAAPSGGILFDEIEKAHPLVMDLFLQILWQGRVTLATGAVLDLTPCYLGFTSNIGGGDAMRMAHSRFSSVEQAVLRRVTQTLRPELVARLSEILVFAPLGAEAQREICALILKAETARLQGLGYDLSVSREALEFLVREGFHPQLGARPMRRAVEHHLQDAVVRALFASGTAQGTLSPRDGRLHLASPNS
ncbi:MAG: ATPase [Verrucomicrobia bacterium]|nr:ATPase [Verrucomicrobiota bacterium]